MTIRLALSLFLIATIQGLMAQQRKLASATNHSTVYNSHTDAVHSPTKFAVTENKKIAYRVIGKGKPIILCNRFRGILDSWDPAFLDELGKKFKVIIFDYSGIGLSSGVMPSEIAKVAEDVTDLASFLKLTKFIIGGWSYGGIVAQTFAVHYPSSVTHIILIGTNPPGKNEHPPEQIFLERSAKPVNDFDDEIILFFEPQSHLSRNAARLSHDRIALRTKDIDIPVSPEKFQWYYTSTVDFAADNFNSRVKLGALKKPILSISGDHDCVCPVENWYALSHKMKNLQIVMLPQAGHGPQHQYVKTCVEYFWNFAEHFKLE